MTVEAANTNVSNDLKTILKYVNIKNFSKLFFSFQFIPRYTSEYTQSVYTSIGFKAKKSRHLHYLETFTVKILYFILLTLWGIYTIVTFQPC